MNFRHRETETETGGGGESDSEKTCSNKHPQDRRQWGFRPSQTGLADSQGIRASCTRSTTSTTLRETQRGLHDPIWYRAAVDFLWCTLYSLPAISPKNWNTCPGNPPALDAWIPGRGVGPKNTAKQKRLLLTLREMPINPFFALLCGICTNWGAKLGSWGITWAQSRGWAEGGGTYYIHIT